MKTIKTLLLIFCVSISINSQAQNKEKNKEILKVSYTSGCVTEFLVNMLKKQILSPKHLTEAMGLMNDYKNHNSYYYNLKTKESIFVLDSITKVDGLNAIGNTYYVHNKEGSINGREIFMGNKINFEEHVNNLKWTFTDEQKEINGYQCKKAVLETNSEISVWFTPEIPVNGGPYIFVGLPGLVLESNTPFESITTNVIAYASEEEFKNKINETKRKKGTGKIIPLSEVFAKKDNFQRMVENQNN